METICICRFCEQSAVWQIWLEGELGRPEVAYACEVHATAHVKRAIILPESTHDFIAELPRIAVSAPH